MTLNVGLIFSEDFFNYNFGFQHPLRPIRLELTIKLMEAYGLLKNPKLKQIKPRMATKEELMLIHNQEYVEFVKEYSSYSSEELIKKNPRGKFGLGTLDDPVFSGMYNASALVCGASILGAEILLKNNEIDHVFNFGGGLHHAFKSKAHGFCIFNDVALAIQKIRIKDPSKKIFYLDIDAHHGDGVQQAFYDDPNVLTLSIHQDGNSLFPGTGFMEEIGIDEGKNYSINFPIYPGTYDTVYIEMFKNLIPKIIKAYKPDIIVSQLGVDTHFSDPLTMLGLSTTGHEKLYKLIHEYTHEFSNGNWLALGGGGYLMTVVPRSWTLALQVMLDENPLPNAIPMEWIEFCEKKITDEEAPYELRDTNFRVEEQLVKNPMFSVRIEQRINEIEEFVYNKVLPNI